MNPPDKASSRSTDTPSALRIRVTFYSYFRELTGKKCVEEQVEPGATVADVYTQLVKRFPRLGPMRNSTLVAVGVEYQTRDYVLKAGDELALFPPVQGG